MNKIHLQTICYFLFAFFVIVYTVGADEYSTTSRNTVTVKVPSDCTLLKVSIKNGAELKIGDKVGEGDFIALIVDKQHNKITVTSGVSGEIVHINRDVYKKFTSIPAGTAILKIEKQSILAQSTESKEDEDKLSFSTVFRNLLRSTGLYALIYDKCANWIVVIG